MNLADNLSPEQTSSHEQAEDVLLLVACAVALLTLIPVALYQTKAILMLPDPPLRVFDSEKITMSDAARPAGIPDSLLGLASYSTTAALIVATKRNELLRPWLGAKLALDLGAATFNSVRQVVSFGQLCSWWSWHGGRYRTHGLCRTRIDCRSGVER